MEGRGNPYKIERRKELPPWSGYQMVPLTPIRDARFDLIERAQALARKDRNPDKCEIPSFVLLADPCDDVAPDDVQECLPDTYTPEE